MPERMLDLLLVEDHDKLRRALRTGLEGTGSVRVVYDCGSGEEALEVCLNARPDVILMDLHLVGVMYCSGRREELCNAARHARPAGLSRPLHVQIHMNGEPALSIVMRTAAVA